MKAVLHSILFAVILTGNWTLLCSTEELERTILFAVMLTSTWALQGSTEELEQRAYLKILEQDTRRKIGGLPLFPLTEEDIVYEAPRSMKIHSRQHGGLMYEWDLSFDGIDPDEKSATLTEFSYENDKRRPKVTTFKLQIQKIRWLLQSHYLEASSSLITIPDIEDLFADRTSVSDDDYTQFVANNGPMRATNFIVNDKLAQTIANTEYHPKVRCFKATSQAPALCLIGRLKREAQRKEAPQATANMQN